MATQCGDILSKEVQWELSEANEEAQRWAENGMLDRLWEEYQTEMPAIEAAVEARVIECLKEGVENGREETLEMLTRATYSDSASSRETDILKLDLDLEPTDEEYKAMFDVGKDLEITKDFAIIDMPVVTGIKGDESISIKDKELQEMGVDKSIPKIPHLDIETTKALAREVLGFLKTDQRIRSDWKDQAAVNMVVGVDKQEPGSERGKIAAEKAVPPGLLKADPYRSRNLYLFQNSAGRLLPKDKEERSGVQGFQWKIAHGIWHINEPDTAKVFEANKLEWVIAQAAQGTKGLVTDYAAEEQRELRAEHYAAWVTNPDLLCPQMREFFDKYFS